MQCGIFVAALSPVHQIDPRKDDQMTTVKTLTALTLLVVLAACSGADKMAFAPGNEAALHNVPTTMVIPNI